MESKRNKMITKIIIVFIVVIVLCTYFSKTVENMLLPKVTVIQLKPGAIGEGFEGTGTVEYEDTHTIYSMPDWTVKEIEVKVNQNIKKGDVLAKVDNDQITLMEREEQEVIMELQDEINSLKKLPNPDQDKLKEDLFKLDTENIKYKEIRKGLTGDGSILSDMDGKIVGINPQNVGSFSAASEGDGSGEADSLAGDALFEIVPSEPSLSVKWTVSSKDADEFSIGDNVNVATGDDDENSKLTVVTATVSEKTYNAEKDEYEFSAIINDNSNLKQDDKVTVSTEASTKRYDNVIPKSCLYDEEGTDYVYEVSARSGSLGEEDYVQKVQVQVGASDDLNCSIKATSDLTKGIYGIVSNASKPIEDNDEVKPIFPDSSR
jgi:HlyD family secretion protein